MGSHVIHIVRINPDEYDVELIKANEGKGREAVSAMAQKSAAEIAINGGFFDIGGKVDGKATGTLVIQGKVYHLNKTTQSFLLIKKGQLSFKREIPQKQEGISMVSGIPMLVSEGKICDGLAQKKSDFFTKAHARTAIGIDQQNNIIIVVAEHCYLKDMMAVTLGELQSLFKEKAPVLTEKYKKPDLGHITLKEIKEIVRDEFTSPTGTQGLSILALAQFMKELGCVYALNLDGGGSSALWIKDKIVNNIFGDEDEAMGEKVERLVSDAIVFRKKG